MDFNSDTSRTDTRKLRGVVFFWGRPREDMLVPLLETELEYSLHPLLDLHTGFRAGRRDCFRSPTLGPSMENEPGYPCTEESSNQSMAGIVVRLWGYHRHRSRSRFRMPILRGKGWSREGDCKQNVERFHCCSFITVPTS